MFSTINQNQFRQNPNQKTQNDNQNNKFNFINTSLSINEDIFKCNTKKRRQFMKSEDDLIIKAVQIFGTTNWKVIAKLVPGRSRRQCRDRYMNYLAPGLNQVEWTEEEDKLLAEKYILYGSQWKLISKYFPNRSSNMIKNRFNYQIRNKIKDNEIKPNENRKETEYNQIFNIFDAQSDFDDQQFNYYGNEDDSFFIFS